MRCTGEARYFDREVNVMLHHVHCMVSYSIHYGFFQSIPNVVVIWIAQCAGCGSGWNASMKNRVSDPIPQKGFKITGHGDTYT